MSNKPFVIEFTGTPDSGKTSTINALVSEFNSKGFNTYCIKEVTKSKAKGIDRRKWNGYLWIRLRMLIEVLEATSSGEYDIILIDRGIYDGLFWLKLFYEDGRCNKEQYISMKAFLENCFPKYPDILMTFYVSTEEAINRKLATGNTNTDKAFISFYNELLIDFYNKIRNQDKFFIDTSHLTIEETINYLQEIIEKNL